VNAVAMVCGSFPAAEDAVQEALLRAWTRSSRGERIERLGAWVVTVALNLSRSGLRRRIAERRARERIGSAPAQLGPSVDAVDVDRALASLPRRQREVAVLRYLLDLDTKEVATVLGVSEGTVKNSLSKARTALAATLRIQEVPSDG
jgi:RNA polymerase sigma-70 factor (ECF subfamily)